MTFAPYNTMPKKEVERHLAMMSPPDREQALNALDHSCSMYDALGNHLPHDYEKENLLEVIGKRDAYLIDNSSEWRKHCLLPENRDKAFIISPSLSRENPNTKELILDKVRCKLGTIFSVGILPKRGGNFCILVDRLDEHFRYTFDNAKLTEASKGKGPTVAKQREEIWRMIENEKREIRPLIEAQRAADLPPPERIRVKIETFKSEIKRLAPECKHNIYKAKELVALCYATLLMEDSQPKRDEGPRYEFDLPEYEHVFGDMYVVQGAIYLRANILTRDGPQTQMASYADIKCYHVPRHL